MKLPDTIIMPRPAPVHSANVRFLHQVRAANERIHTTYVRNHPPGIRLALGHRIATICYQLVPGADGGVVFAATWFRKDSPLEHWNKKNARQLALRRLDSAPVILSLPLEGAYKEKFPTEYAAFQLAFLTKRGCRTLEDYNGGSEAVERAWNALIQHTFARKAIRKAMHTEGCWEKNSHLV